MAQGSLDTFWHHPQRKRTALLAFVLAAMLTMTLVVTGGGIVMLHVGEPGQVAAPNSESYLPAGDIWQILDLAAPAPFLGYAFAQSPPDSTPPTFVSSELDGTMMVLTITFSEAIDAANVVPAKIHIRASGNYAHGVTLTAGELGTVADGATILFNLNATRLAAVVGLAAPELTIEPGAVRDVSGNLIIGTFEASTAAFVDSFSVLPQSSGPQGMAFSSDGAKMFVVGNIVDNVDEYELSTPFDVSTAVNVSAISVQLQEYQPTGIAFSNDGAKMFVIGTRGVDVNEYDLSTPFDVSTAVNVTATSVSAREGTPQGMAFSNDGTKMFVVGWGSNGVTEYKMSTPFDTSNATFVGSLSISDQEIQPMGIAFSSDGAKMFVIGIVGKSVNEYKMFTPFDTSNVTFVDATSISDQETYPTGIAFSNDGAKMFVIGYTGKDVNEYDLRSVYPIAVRNNLPMSVQVGGNQTVGEGDTVLLSGSATDPDGDPITYAWSQTVPATPLITFVNASASSTTFTAPSVTGDTTFTITLTIHDGTQYATDALNVTVKETGTAFVTTWTTTKRDLIITLPMEGTYSILWGNSSYTENVNGPISSTYGAAGDYTVTLLGDGLKYIRLHGDAANARQLKSIDQWGDTDWTTMDRAFRGASSMTYNATDAPNLSRVTNMTSMFHGTPAFNGDLSSWDVSSVTDMTNVFRDATSFNGDLSSWDVSSVTDMSSMFAGATSFNQSLSAWDVSSVTDMTNVFRDATSFNRPLSSWDVSSVTDMASMFRGATSFNQSLSAWDVSSVTNMVEMFAGATSFNWPLSSWDVSSVTHMSSMFARATSFNQPLSSWDVSSVRVMGYMFDDADLFDQNLGAWYVVPADTVFYTGDTSLGVTTISTQNGYLRSQYPNYGMGSSEDSAFFNMTGPTLTFINAPTAGVSYKANVTASGTSVFEKGNNWRMLDITVRGGTNNAPTAEAGRDLNVDEGSSVTLEGSGSDPDSDRITYAWSQYPETPVVTFDNISSAAPLVTAPSVAANTTITLTLTVRDDDDTSARDTMVLTILNVTVTTAADTTAPVIELDGSATITITVDGTYNEQGAVCDDDVDPDKPATVGGQTVDTGTAGTYTITYDCTDTSNNVADQVTRTVTVEAATDNTPPVIELDGSATITITVDGTYNEQGAVCDDDVDPDKPATVGGQTVDTGTAGTYTITYDCTDTSNNVADQVTRTVTVEAATDNTPPVIELDGSATITITVDGTYNEQGAVCDDDVDPDKPATVGGQTVDTGTAGTYTITYDCTDTSNNAATQVTRTVTVEAATDNTPPVIELDGSATITITVDGTYNEQGAVCDDDVDPDKPATVGGQTVDTGTAGTYTITYDCTDTSNNVADQVTRTVTVEAATDNTPPVIELDGSATITITVDGTYNEQGAVCDDDVDPDKPATVGGQTVDTGTAGTYTITYDCTDTSNNAATQVTRTVTVREAGPDTTPPVIELDGPATITITVDGTYNEQGAVCDDDVDPDKPATVGGQTVDTGTAGTYTITYDCTDTSNNAATQVTRTVTVEAATDNTPPVIELDGPATITITVDGTYNEQGAVCDDDVDPDKPATVGGQTVDVDTAGTYTITYDCTDTSNNVADQVTRTVTVEAATDNTPPVIELDGPATITITVGGTYNEQGAVCDDDVDPDKPATVGGQTVDVDTAGTYTITYDCTDTSNNVADQVTRTVTVEAATDNTPPVIELDGPATITITVGGTYNEQGAVCDDDVDPDKPATVGGQTVDVDTAGTYTITYDCTDTSNNVADQVTRTVTVLPDTTKPVITIQGANPARIVVNGTYTDAGAACMDAVDSTIIPTVVSNTVDTTQTGTYSVIYSCSDTSNNAATATRTVIVQTAVIPDTDRSSKSRSNNTPNPLTIDNSIIIDGQSYDLGSGTTTTTNPYNITTGQATDLVFTAYSPSDIVRFTVYLNLHGDDIKHSDSDTYIRYDHGVVEIVDPHGFISDASITITEDPEQSRKKIINTLVEFEGNMGLTNMAVYIWNEDRRYTSIRVFNALDITSGTETLPDPEPVESDSGLPADPESVAPGFEDDAVDPEHTSSDTPWPDNYDDAQVLTLIRMWSGFEAESITDDQLLTSLGFDYPDADMPDWMMTQLGVLVAKGDVTVGEFVLALQYVLEHAYSNVHKFLYSQFLDIVVP